MNREIPYINKTTGLFRYELFNFIKFKKFLEENKSFASAISIVIATHISTLSASFTDNIIIPIFNRDVNKDGIKDIKYLEDLELNIFNIKFKLGKFVIDIIKFMFVLYILFLIASFYEVELKN